MRLGWSSGLLDLDGFLLDLDSLVFFGLDLDGFFGSGLFGFSVGSGSCWFFL